MKDIKVIIALHKKYQVPTDKMYLPLHVGAEGKEDIGYKKDNIGKNISSKNPYYCELTGIYWAWKNLKADYVGLVHYRRYFFKHKIHTRSEDKKFENVLTLREADEIFKNTDIILPKMRKYYIENLYDHYKHTLYVEPLDETGKIIAEKYPEYSEAFEKIKIRRSAHMFNMFIMKKEHYDKYCKWLFDILCELEKRVDDSKYDDFHKRFYGRISELLLDVWINTNDLSYKEVDVMDMQNINWFTKGMSFLKAKFLGSKYKGSFK